MSDMNSIVITGNLVRDCEVRQAGTGTVGKLTIANGQRHKKGQGVETHTSFFQCELWNRDALYPHLTKGKKVGVSGVLRLDQWTDKEGKKRETPIIRVAALSLFSDGQSHAAGPGGPVAQAQYPAPAFVNNAPQPQYVAPVGTPGAQTPYMAGQHPGQYAQPQPGYVAPQGPPQAPQQPYQQYQQATPPQQRGQQFSNDDIPF